MRRIIGFTTAFALTLFCLICTSTAAPAIDQGKAKAASTAPTAIAKTSVIVERIGEFDYEDDTFNATFWIASETDSPSGNPLEGIELANSIRASTESFSEVAAAGKRIFRKRILGTFHHAWDLSRYPFDRENLQIILKDTKETSGNFSHFANTAASGLRDIPKVIGEWRVTGFTIKNERTEPVESNLLNLGGTNSETIDSLLVFTVNLTNAHTKGALKLLSGGIIAACIAAISYTLTPNIISNPNSRFGALTASLFAAVISMRSAYGYLGNLYTITLIDKIYFLILAYIFFSFACTSYLWRINKNPNRSHLVQTYSFRAGALSTLTLIVLITFTAASTAFAG